MIVKTKDILFFVWLTLLALAAVVYAIVTIPSPQQQRDLKIDLQRINNLTTIEQSITSYYNQTASLPPSLDKLAEQDTWINENLLDPQTQQPYTYIATGEKSYQLCANFNMETPSQKKARTSYSLPYQPKEFTHPKGNYCFHLTVNDFINKPYPMTQLLSPTASPSSPTPKMTPKHPPKLPQK